MTTYELYSSAKEQEALALLKQLLLILCNNDISVIGATGIAPTAPNILKQIAWRAYDK